ncbi:UNVERIFIED_CONTAM: hypothetical protein GTU68_016573 [Idotea baltica]|nr:hypothetical protein [Idotea baltica]
MILLDGKKTANEIAETIKNEVIQLSKQRNRVPHLVAVLVGDNPASQSYVRNKTKMCDKVGFQSTTIRKESSTTENELLTLIETLNDDILIDGFIVQLPLPSHINENKILMAIDPAKDVDGFHPMNLGLMTKGLDAFLPATPMGILELLRHYEIETSGKNCVILGRSNIVGKPMGILMSRNEYPGNCTVTLCHSRTLNTKEICRQADIIIAAIGKAHFLEADMIKEGAIVIDVGINSIDVGDADFEGLRQKCSYITPVPGGVGPMTVISLMKNTLKAYAKSNL